MMNGCCNYSFAPGIVTSGAAAAWTTLTPIPVRGGTPGGRGSNEAPGGSFSLQVSFTGTGAATISALCTNDDETVALASREWVVPEGAVNLFTSKTYGSWLTAFSIPACESFKLKVQNLGGALTFTKFKVVVI